MHLTRALTTALLTGAAYAVPSGDVSGISFAASGQRLQIVGVDYQPGGQAAFDYNTGHDVLSDPDACLRDAAILQQLGVNTIRVYNVNPTTNHDSCMSIFNAAGIYVIVDVNSPFMSLHRDDPGPSYTAEYLSYIFSQVDNFKDYPNTLAFFAANEVINDEKTGTLNPPYIRAITRDLRQYIAKQSTRHIPVGYSAADVRSVLKDTWAYLTCSINGEAGDISKGELFGLNSYSWCGDKATYTSAGYDQLVDMFKSTTVPVFFSEYGCNIPIGTPRVFNEVQALYGTDMTGLNGGLVYEYSQEPSNYGLVEINADGSVKLLKDFDNLQVQYNKLDKSLLTKLPSSTASAFKCDSSLITSSGFNNTWSIPVQPAGVDKLIASGVPNARKGKLVDVTVLDVKQKVIGSNGNTITGLKLKKTDGSNLPSGATTSSSGNGNSGNTSSTGKKGAASSMYEVNGRLVAGVLALVGMMAALW